MLSSKLQATSDSARGQASDSARGHVRLSTRTRPTQHADTSDSAVGLNLDSKPAAKRESKSEPNRDTAAAELLGSADGLRTLEAAPLRTPQKQQQRQFDNGSNTVKITEQQNGTINLNVSTDEFKSIAALFTKLSTRSDDEQVVRLAETLACGMNDWLEFVRLREKFERGPQFKETAARINRDFGKRAPKPLVTEAVTSL